jgi:hypothetical protein
VDWRSIALAARTCWVSCSPVQERLDVRRRVDGRHRQLQVGAPEHLAGHDGTQERAIVAMGDLAEPALCQVTPDDPDDARVRRQPGARPGALTAGRRRANPVGLAPIRRTEPAGSNGPDGPPETRLPALVGIPAGTDSGSG